MKFSKLVKTLIKPIVPLTIQKLYVTKLVRMRVRKAWNKSGKPLPAPDLIKYKIINDIRKRHGINILIETGTFLGGMIDYNKNNFKEIHTIELMEKYFLDAQKKFSAYKHIHCYQGDSAKVLWEIIPKLQHKSLFWLDGHYSVDIFARGDKDCPVLEELDAIFSNDLGHVIIIDDARDFKGVGDYPTVQTVIDHVKSKNPKYKIILENDMFICTL